MKRFVLPVLLGAIAALTVPVRADRIILAPRGLITTFGAVRGEFAASGRDYRRNLAWVNFGVPPEDLGLELEVEHSELREQRGTSLSAQYTLTGNALTDINGAAAFTVGLRDALNSGRDGRAIYFAATKTIGLSLFQERLLRKVRVHIGFGSGRLEGPFAAVESGLPLGFGLGVEYVGGKVNAALDYRIARYAQLRAYTVDGQFFYGASLFLRR